MTSGSGSQPALDAPTIEAIVNCDHGDVFGVLGLQQNPSGTGLVIRAFLPLASSVAAVGKNGRSIATLAKIHEAGLLEAVMPRRKNRFAYRFRIDDAYDLEDPYRFPSQVSADDVYWFNEGTHEKNYQWMGAHARTIVRLSASANVAPAGNSSASSSST